MANFTLESAIKRLSLRPSALCKQCRRSFASTASRQETRSATRAFSDHVQSTREQSATRTQTATASPTTSSFANITPPKTVSAPIPARQRSSIEIASDHLRQSYALKQQREEEEKKRDAEREYSPADLERQIHRRWKPGDVYAPHDLTGVEMSKWKKLRRRGRQRFDVVDMLGIDPRQHYKNFSVMSEYMTEMGRIKGSRETGLRPKNQRRMAKAIRRAIGLGLMPGVHRHPELLKQEHERRTPYY